MIKLPANPEGKIITEDMVAQPDSNESPTSDDIITNPEIPLTEADPFNESSLSLDETQFQTFQAISERLDLLTNRFEIMLLLFIVLLTLFIYNLMRSKS